MRILSAVQTLFAVAFLVFGVVTLFGIGITGLLFLVPGAVFAAMAGVLALVGVGVLAVLLDWRSLRSTTWF